MANTPAQTPTKLDQRLKEVRQTDLTEGRINQDFVDWLKTKGMTYLLVLLLGLCAYLVWIRFQHSRDAYKAEAWRELANAALPSSLEDVANKYGDVGAVAFIARLNAAAELLRSVQMGKTLGADESTRSNLTDEQRMEYLERADRLYREMLDKDDRSAGKTLLMVTALTGRAVIAESRGEDDKAREFYGAAASRAGDAYPELAEHSRHRANLVGKHTNAAVLPTDAQVQAIRSSGAQESGRGVQIEPWIRTLIDEQSTATQPNDQTASGQ